MQKPSLSTYDPAGVMPQYPLVAIVGGAGFVGSAVTEAFAAAGWRVRVVGRNTAHGMHLRPLGDLGQIAPVKADVRNPASLLPAFAEADAVINLAGILDEKGGQGFEAVHVRGAEAVARAARVARVKALVHVSAIGADADSPSAYGRTKAAGESAVRHVFQEAAIVRPSLVFGPEDGFTNRFANLMQSAPVVPVIAPDCRFQPVFVVDVASALLEIVRRHLGGERGGTYELGGPEVLTMRQIMHFVASATGQEKVLVDTPDFGARMLSGLGFLPGAPLTKDQYLMLQRDNVAAAGLPGLMELGVAATPLEGVAHEWLDRYRAGGRFAARG